MQNLGVNLRILLIVNGLLATAALALSSDMHEFLFLLTGISAVAQPMLMLSLLLLYLGYPLLTRLSYWQGISAMLLTVLVACGSLHHVFAQLQIFDSLPGLTRTLFFVAITTGITLYYFNLHHRAYSPAVAEARLQALQARIRPHFLFNSINAVLSLIRSQPKQAETALEDMADLFRVLMADNRELVPLAQEIGLCRQYLALEKLRLEDRLKIEWQIDDMPPDALIPPLVLQPLLENAVYHGIEPLPEGGTITIRIYTKGKDVHVILSNPYAMLSNHHSGNKMALKNIKERLTLHFDLEANLKTRRANGQYQVHIVLPYSHA